MDFHVERVRMVRDQIQSRGIHDARVIDAMLAVAREEFLPTADHGLAYEDRPLPIAHGQTISQPYIVARMTELLELPERSRVLEIGSGCGYQTAVLAQIADHVDAVERDPRLVRQARRTLFDLGFMRIDMRCGDGFLGWPGDPGEGYDGILVACAAESFPDALVAQLRPNRRLVIPIGPHGGIQELVRLYKGADGAISTETHGEVRFVPMVPGVEEGGVDPADGGEP